MRTPSSTNRPGRAGGQQRGLALVVALIILVVMSLAGVAMVRSIDTGILVAGNLAFRQGSAHAGQRGIEEARHWLTNHSAELADDHPADGYYSSSQDVLDLTGNLTPSTTADDVKWGSAAGMSTPKCMPEDEGKNTVCFIIHRLCSTSGIELDSSQCTTRETVAGGSSLGALRQMGTYQQGAPASVNAYGYYRVTVRTSGPRNTVSFLQALVIIAKA
jgi:type IV pilus assembly protein PilX